MAPTRDTAHKALKLKLSGTQMPLGPPFWKPSRFNSKTLQTSESASPIDSPTAHSDGNYPPPLRAEGGSTPHNTMIHDTFNQPFGPDTPSETTLKELYHSLDVPTDIIEEARKVYQSYGTKSIPLVAAVSEGTLDLPRLVVAAYASDCLDEYSTVFGPYTPNRLRDLAPFNRLIDHFMNPQDLTVIHNPWMALVHVTLLEFPKLTDTEIMVELERLKVVHKLYYSLTTS